MDSPPLPILFIPLILSKFFPGLSPLISVNQCKLACQAVALVQSNQAKAGGELPSPFSRPSRLRVKHLFSPVLIPVILFRMLATNLTASIMIVFAGGPHTPERTALACDLLAHQPPPSIIYLTGIEFTREYSHLATRVKALADTLPTRPAVMTDTCTTTWASCRKLGNSTKKCGAAAVIITSNYHAPRVRWLFNAAPLTILTTPDIPWHKAFATSRNRQLIMGECLSWLYCGPLGLLIRPAWLAVIGLLALGAYAAFRQGRLHH